MENIKETKKANWKYAIDINQLDGAWKPDPDFSKLIEKEINGEISTADIRQILTEKYSKKYSSK